MKPFNTETAVTFLELQQMLVQFGHEIDLREGRNVINFFENDGIYVLNGTTYQGHAGIKQFHEKRFKHLHSEYPNGLPTSRHIFTNWHISMVDEDQAILTFMAFYYIGAGRPQVPDSIIKTNVVDCRMECRRALNSQWRIKLLENTVILSSTNPIE